MKQPVQQDLLAYVGVLFGSMERGQANQRNPPQETGPSASPGKRGSGPSGSGRRVAWVFVA
ncbi:MAG: hypothetical protein QM757_35765 [Paludibaculum sp.]